METSEITNCLRGDGKKLRSNERGGKARKRGWSVEESEIKE